MSNDGSWRDAGVDRRQFVRTCACTLAGFVGGGLTACASVAVRPVTPVNGRVELALTQYPELAEAGGTLRIQPRGSSDPVYVTALDERRFAALSPICTHLGCTVDIQGDRFVCPCHGSTYDREGTVLQGPAERPLARYRTDVTADGVLIIHLERSDAPRPISR